MLNKYSIRESVRRFKSFIIVALVILAAMSAAGLAITTVGFQMYVQSMQRMQDVERIVQDSVAVASLALGVQVRQQVTNHHLLSNTAAQSVHSRKKLKTIRSGLPLSGHSEDLLSPTGQPRFFWRILQTRERRCRRGSSLSPNSLKSRWIEIRHSAELSTTSPTTSFPSSITRRDFVECRLLLSFR